MKKTINGKRYDTETADKIAEFSKGNSNDFNYISEELYKTKKGNWFLFGEGGANSCYSESNGNSRWGSSDIIPYSENEAFKWLQENNKNEAIDTHFFDRVEEA